MMILNDRTRGLMLSLVVLLSLNACGGATEGGSSGAGLPTDQVTPTPVTPTDPVTPTPVIPTPVIPTDPVTPTPVAPPTIPPVPPANQAPTITGSPVTLGQTDRPYAFKPKAADVDGDGLAFSISGKPKWAAFDAVTGVLSGTPPAGSAGAYPGIAISVSDGQLTATLALFSIAVSAAPTKTVTLNWKAPSMNVDGTALTDLAGYVVSYGAAARSYTTSINIVGAGSTSVVIEGFEPGTWYFALKSVNVPGVQSDYTGEVVAVL